LEEKNFLNEISKLDINKISKQNTNIKIGELTEDIINKLNLDLKPQNIYLWGARINEHCEKHKLEYSSINAFNEAISNIPQIIKNPDYVSLNSEHETIQYIKKLNDTSLVGIKILKNENKLLFRTIFPITESKLDYNLQKGLYKKI
jgi:hypothetical protein